MRWHSVAYARVHPWACCTVLLLMAGSLFALAWVAFTPPAARVIYNASDSVPVGWYRVTPLDAEIATPRDAIAVDSFVLTRLPASVATLGRSTRLPAFAGAAAETGRCGSTAAYMYFRGLRAYRRRACGHCTARRCTGATTAGLATVSPTGRRRTVPAQQHHPGVLRQPLLWAG